MCAGTCRVGEIRPGWSIVAMVWKSSGMDDERRWWYFLRHNRPERNGDCPGKDRLGPRAPQGGAAPAPGGGPPRNEGGGRQGGAGPAARRPGGAAARAQAGTCPAWLPGARVACLPGKGNLGAAFSSSRKGRALTDDSTGAGLPSAARARLAEIRGSGTWGSALSTDEFAAIRGVGFEPVGQVLGACVYNIGYTGAYGCAGGWSSAIFGGVVTAATQVSGQGGWGSYGPLTQAMYDARRKAIGRMTAECAALGGHGIVGVSLSFGPFPAGGLEFRAIGTPLPRAAAPARPDPF